MPVHLVLIFQGSNVSLGWVDFGRFLDNHRVGILRKFFNGNYRVTLIDNILLHRGHKQLKSFIDHDAIVMNVKYIKDVKAVKL